MREGVMGGKVVFREERKRVGMKPGREAGLVGRKGWREIGMEESRIHGGRKIILLFFPERF